MSMEQPRWASERDPNRRRRVVRYAAAAACAVTALLYYGIGVGTLKIVDQLPADMPDLFPFGALAGSGFVLGAILLVAFDHRGAWLLGAALQVVALVMYVAVSPQRDPPFEPWGILIKVLQVGILGALLYLVLRQPVRRPGHVIRSF